MSLLFFKQSFLLLNVLLLRDNLLLIICCKLCFFFLLCFFQLCFMKIDLPCQGINAFFQPLFSFNHNLSLSLLVSSSKVFNNISAKLTNSFCLGFLLPLIALYTAYAS